ncbi:MAG: electron transport complex subunit RsxA [Candidatus Auribacterota bacterium]|jgi:electron transport complex protein RnfA|uniref:Ion-translocating oxidoreductase complex subunit A n=1 Tax=Candidatus Auribacter fodinae TaxID=2093366 RepID=A0A3A4QUK7_9BACT|nr:MAG: electron transport complex subunit RsxA [Candidatus Auribacter fodinae]
MFEIGAIFKIFLATVLVNNFILFRFLGLCPYIGVSKNTDSALGMGMAVIFVMTLTAIVTWFIYHYLLVPFHIEYLHIIAFILTIAALVQLVEMIIQKTAPALYEALGIYLPLITTNCAVLGVAMLNKDTLFGQNLSFIKCVVQGFGAGVGFTIAMVLMAGIRERLDIADVPQPLKGVPIAFIAASLLAIAFLGFSGMI